MIAASIPDRRWVILLMALGAAAQVLGIALAVTDMRSRDQAAAAQEKAAAPSGVDAVADAGAGFGGRLATHGAMAGVLRTTKQQRIGLGVVFAGAALTTAGSIWALYLSS